jgi:hypothetical protein
LREVFPPDETKWDSAKVDSWNWDAYLASAIGCVQQFSDTLGLSRLATAQALCGFAKKLMAVIPPDVYAWDDAGNNRWLISGKGSGIMPRGPKGRFVGQLPQFYGLSPFNTSGRSTKSVSMRRSPRS